MPLYRFHTEWNGYQVGDTIEATDGFGDNCPFADLVEGPEPDSKPDKPVNEAAGNKAESQE